MSTFWFPFLLPRSSRQSPCRLLSVLVRCKTREDASGRHCSHLFVIFCYVFSPSSHFYTFLILVKKLGGGCVSTTQYLRKKITSNEAPAKKKREKEGEHGLGSTQAKWATLKQQHKKMEMEISETENVEVLKWFSCRLKKWPWQKRKCCSKYTTHFSCVNCHEIHEWKLMPTCLVFL